MTRHLTRVLAVTALAAVAACSGGGSTPPAASKTGGTSGGSTSSATGHATLTFKRLTPAATTAATSSKRGVKEFSDAANSLVIDATQSGATPVHQVFDISGALIGNGVTCTTDVSGEYQQCTLQVLLPLGDDTVTVATNSARDGSGSTLGSATLNVTILNAQDNPISITLDGTVASMRLFVSDPAPIQGTSVSLPLTVQLYDATGTILIAPQNYTTPVTVADNETTTATTLFTAATQNSTQRYNGTNPVNTSPSPAAKTVSVPDRYTVPYLQYDGSAIPAFTVTATFGTLTSSVTVTPATAATRPSGSVVKHALSTVRSYDPIFDANGTLWVTQTGGQISSIDKTSFAVTGSYLVAAVGTRSLRAPVLGPDGALYMTSATVSNGAATAPYYVTRFDTTAHTFTDVATLTDQPLHLTVANNAIVGAERNVNKVWSLPFTGTTPGTPFEFSVAAPPATDPTPVLLPLPTRAFPSGDGNLYLIFTSYFGVDGTWIAKYSPSGTLVTQPRLVDPTHPAALLDAQVMTSSGVIWFINLLNSNELVRDDTTATPNALTTYAVPRLYGEQSFSEITQYTALDSTNDLYFTSYLTSSLGRIDNATGRIDLFNAPANSAAYGMTIYANTLYTVNADTSQAQQAPFIDTLSTQ